MVRRESGRAERKPLGWVVSDLPVGHNGSGVGFADLFRGDPPMTACLLWCCLSTSVLSAPAPDEMGDAKPLVLLAATDEYKTAKGVEAVYEGVIENNPGGGGAAAPTRFNAYRL